MIRTLTLLETRLDAKHCSRERERERERERIRYGRKGVKGDRNEKRFDLGNSTVEALIIKGRKE